MARKRAARQETSAGGSDSSKGDEGYVWWTKKAGRTTGFDFRTNSAIFGDGTDIPIAFLEGEARRDQSLFGRIIPMDSPDFATVREGFYRRLQDFEESSKTEQCSLLGSPRPHGRSNSAMGKSMDRHADRQSLSIDKTTDVKRYAQLHEAPGARSPRQSCSPLSLRTPASDNMRTGDDASSASLPDAASILMESDHASSSRTRQEPRRSQDDTSNARSGEQRATRSQWTPGKTALYSQRLENGAQRCVTVLVTTTQRVARGGMFSSTDERGQISVTDGANDFFVAEEELTELEVSSCLVARLQSGAGASPSATVLPTPQKSVPDVWEWLTPVGLAQAQSSAVPVPKGVVPHLVGKGGATIRKIEELIGVIIGVMDGQDGQAQISLVGPQQKVAAARQLIIAATGGGVWSLLRRIKDRGPLFV